MCYVSSVQFYTYTLMQTTFSGREITRYKQLGLDVSWLGGNAT